MIKKITKYIKYYFEPCSEKLAIDAFESAKEYFSDKERSVNDMIVYQQSYKTAYRQTYAKNKLNTI